MTNSEAYNDLNLQKNFLETNGLKNEQINIYDYDNEKDKVPYEKLGNLDKYIMIKTNNLVKKPKGVNISLASYIPVDGTAII